jgi:hypothetical protein
LIDQPARVISGHLLEKVHVHREVALAHAVFAQFAEEAAVRDAMPGVARGLVTQFAILRRDDLRVRATGQRIVPAAGALGD